MLRVLDPRSVAAALCLAIACAPQLGLAGPIVAATFYEFGFTDVGVAATGCQPDDPGGNFCISSSGTPTLFADAPPWTFLAGAGGSTLTVTDAFLSGDRFEIFDFGASFGLTSAPGASDCGDDPVPCLADPGMSHGLFALAAGAHSLTIVLAAGGIGGTGYFAVDAIGQVPEPGSLALAAAALAFVWLFRRRTPGRSRS